MHCRDYIQRTYGTAILLGRMSLQEFCQRESTSSGGILDDDADESGEGVFTITPWKPSPKAIERIKRWCPALRVLRVLIDDQHLERLRDLECPIEEIEAHVTWNGVSGSDLLAVAFAPTLAKLSLTMLDGYSYSVIEEIGRNCLNLLSLHLNFWSADVADEEALELKHAIVFPRLQDLSVSKCARWFGHKWLFPKISFLLPTDQMRGIRECSDAQTFRLFPR